MASIHGRDTKPELVVRKIIYAMGFRYRLHYDKLPGKPDLALLKHKKAVFVNGCFWHGHQDCKRSKTPDSNTDFWKSKIAGNMERDQKNVRDLIEQGWEVLTIWSCEISKGDLLQKKLKDFLYGTDAEEG